jgi:hypothetical protein
MFKNIILIIAIVFALTGCGRRTDEQAKAMINNPDINFVGTYDGCEVKYIDRGYHDQSFYIAKCGDTTTLTRNYTEKQGKSTVDRRSTVITQEIEKLQKEKATAETKEKALEKLSAAEKQVLGIK